MVVELKLLLQKKGRKGLAFYIEMSRYRILKALDTQGLLGTRTKQRTEGGARQRENIKRKENLPLACLTDHSSDQVVTPGMATSCLGHDLACLF